jgi:hypothetical protein
MAGYQGYGAGYGDPQRAKADRARQMAELLQQNVMSNQPQGIVSGLAGLGEAFIARGAMDKADKAEATDAKYQARLLNHLMDPKTDELGWSPSQMQPTINVGTEPETVVNWKDQPPAAATPARASQMPELDKTRALANLLGGVYEGDGRTADIGAKPVAPPPMQPPMPPPSTQPVQPSATAATPAAATGASQMQSSVSPEIEKITAALMTPAAPQPVQPGATPMTPAAQPMAAPTMTAPPAIAQAPQSSRPPPPAAPNRQAALQTMMRYTNGNLEQAMALVEAKYGAAPAKPDYQFFTNENGFVGRGNNASGEWETLQQGTPKAPDLVKMEQYTDATGQVWDRNPYTGESVKANVPRARVPQDGVSSANDTYRPATLEDRARWNLPPEGAFKINERTQEPAAISGARAAQDFSPTEIRGFRDQADGLYILKNAVNQYVTMLEKMGGPQLLDSPFNAKNTQALKSAHGLITEAIKDAGKLGALDQGVQNLVNAIIQEPVGWGTFGKSTDSIKQAANQLYSSIDFKLSRVPEEYRAGSTGAAPDFEGDDDDDDFIDTLFEPAPNPPAPSRATPMATVNPGTSTGRFHRGTDPRQTQRPAAPPPTARQPVQAQQLPPGVTPEMWAVMDDEDKAAFAQ